MASIYEITIPHPEFYGIWHDGTRYANFSLQWGVQRYGPAADNPHGTPELWQTVAANIGMYDGSVESLSFEVEERWLFIPKSWLSQRLGSAAMYSEDFPGMVTEAMKLKSTGSDRYAIRDTTDWNESGVDEGLYRRGRRLTDVQAEIVAERHEPGQGLRYDVRVTKDGSKGGARGVTQEQIISGQWAMYSTIPVRLFDSLQAGMALGTMWREKQSRLVAAASESTVAV